MVNENNGADTAQLPLRRFRLFRRARPNPKAKLLQKGDVVVPNYRSAKARDKHPRGVILSIQGSYAAVRWQDQLTQPDRCELRLLIKVT
ncbi:hypothetical protein [Nonomuraea sp. NPDC049784]|uniref:hypothetical protein n=1 Tax=Nonomuraea sp. NPDC049784 TaxID=3154361 RepID=UPI00340A90A0